MRVSLEVTFVVLPKFQRAYLSRVTLVAHLFQYQLSYRVGSGQGQTRVHIKVEGNLANYSSTTAISLMNPLVKSVICMPPDHPQQVFTSFCPIAIKNGFEMMVDLLLKTRTATPRAKNTPKKKKLLRLYYKSNVIRNMNKFKIKQTLGQ